MQIALGYVLIIVGLVMILAAFLKWLGVIKPHRMRQLGFPEFLAALLEKAGWVVTLGVLLIYFGLKMIGVSLPF